MPYDMKNNYEVTSIEEQPNGEVVVLANGTTVFVKKDGGDWRFRASFEGDFMVQSSRFYRVGDTFEYNGISFIVESVAISGLNRMRTIGGEYFDARHFTIGAISTKAYSGDIDIHAIMAGEEG